MYVQGEATYILRNKDTGEVKEQGKQTNTVAYSFLRDNAIEKNIFVSNRAYPSDPRRFWIYGVVGIGADIPGIPNPSPIYTDSDPFYVEISQRVPAPTSDVTIRTIAILSSATIRASNTAFEHRSADAYLTLTSPIVQTTNDILDVFYRVQYINLPGSGIHPRLLKTIIQNSLQQPEEYDPFNPSSFGFHSGLLANIDKSKFGLLTFQPDTGDDINGTIENVSVDSVIGKWQWNLETNLSNDIGNIIGTVAMGAGAGGSTLVLWDNLKNSSDSPIQQTFGHTSASTVPFYDPATVATGGGTVTLDGSSWADPNLPKIYRVEITTTGATGVSEYRFKVRDVIGTLGNEYTSRRRVLPQFANTIIQDPAKLQDDTIPKPFGTSFPLGDSLMPSGINEYTFLTINESEIRRINFVTQEIEVWNASTTPTLPITNAGQVEVDSSNNIWVSCSNTGLYRISADGLTVTHFDATNTSAFVGPALTNNCYGVDIGNGKVWAIFDGGLAQTSDNGVTWTVYDETTTPAFTKAAINSNWAACKFLRADPSSANDEIGVVYDGGANIDVAWWDLVTGTVTDLLDIADDSVLDTSGEVRERYKGLFQVSDVGSVWVSGYGWNNGGVPVFYTYGTSNKLVSTTPGTNHIIGIASKQCPFVRDSNDDLAVLGADSGGQYWLTYPNGTSSSILPGTNVQNSNATADGIVYLGNGLLLLADDTQSLQLNQLSTNEPLGGLMQNELWTDYGWNGSSWVEGALGNKPTHATAELLHDGITIQFNDNADQFVATEYYTTFVANGAVLDGATIANYSSSIYFRPVVKDVADFTPAVFPATTSTVAAGITVNRDDNLFLGGWTNNTGVTVNDYFTRTSSSATSFINFPAVIRGRCQSTNPLQAGDFFWAFHPEAAFGTSSVEGFIVGLIDPINVGLSYPGNDTHITHGIFADANSSLTDPVLYIRESGVNVYTFPEPFPIRTSEDSSFSFAIERVGTTINYYFATELIYTSSVASSGDVHLEVLLNNRSGIHFHYAYTEVLSRSFQQITGNYIRLGDQLSSTGIYDPDFDMIDTTEPNFSILIDGVPATTVLIDDYVTPLNAGEVSIIIMSGILRYSSADAGKTITGNYNYVRFSNN